MQIEIRVRTGNDDLREGSWANLVVKLRNRIPQNFNEFTGRGGLAGNSSFTTTLRIPELTDPSQLDYLELIHVSQEGLFQTADNWNLEDVVVTFRPDVEPVIADHGFHRFLGNTRVLRFGQSDRLTRGSILSPGNSLYSRNRQFKLAYQWDGNLVLYRLRDWAPLWATETFGRSPGRAAMQEDGNFVLYGANGTDVHWSSATFGPQFFNSYLVMQDDGNLVIHNARGQAVWASNTNQ